MSSPPERVAGSTASSKPLLRGRLHEVAVYVAIPAGLLLIAQARTPMVRLAMTVYALSLIALFASSAAYHRVNWSPRARQRMRKLDHSMIFFLIAGTGTAVASLVLEGLWRIVFLAIIWTGAFVGIAFKLARIDGSARIGGILYIALGWAGAATVPQAVRAARPLPLILIAVGGVLYTIGAVIFFRRKPDPKPLVFGYHEIWHAFVVAACACQYAGITMILRTAH